MLINNFVKEIPKDADKFIRNPGGGGYGLNILPNGDFENWSVSSPDYWSLYAWGSSTFSKENVNVHSGNNAVKMSFDAVNSNVHGVSSAFTLEAGKTYRLQFWHNVPVGKSLNIYFRDASEPASTMYLRFTDSVWQSTAYNLLVGTGVYTLVEVEFTPQSTGANYTILFRRASASNSICYIDDFRVQEKV